MLGEVTNPSFTNMIIPVLLNSTMDVDNMVGTISWNAPGFPTSIYATPFWEDRDGIDINISCPKTGLGSYGELLPYPYKHQDYWTRGKVLHGDREIFVYQEFMSMHLMGILQRYSDHVNDIKPPKPKIIDQIAEDLIGMSNKLKEL